MSTSRHSTFADSLLYVLHSYNPVVYYNKNPELKKAIDQIKDGFFAPREPELFHDVASNLLEHDR